MHSSEEMLAKLTDKEMDELAELVAERVLKMITPEKLAEAIIEHPGLLDGIINYSNKRKRASKSSTAPVS